VRPDDRAAGPLVAFALAAGLLLSATACTDGAMDRPASEIAAVGPNAIYESLPDAARQAALRTRQRALETLPSGRSLDWRQGRHAGKVRPERSYRSVDGSFCRHFTETLHPPQRARRAVACRSGEGLWHVAPGSG
jgi:surface antigen